MHANELSTLHALLRKGLALIMLPVRSFISIHVVLRVTYYCKCRHSLKERNCVGVEYRSAIRNLLIPGLCPGYRFKDKDGNCLTLLAVDRVSQRPWAEDEVRSCSVGRDRKCRVHRVSLRFQRF